MLNISSQGETNTTFNKVLQVVGVVVAVIAAVVSIFFSLRSEKVRELSVTYFEKRPLVSIDSASSRAGLEVRIGDKVITTPWLVSGKLENSGNQPVEERDIESPEKFLFKGAKIISADVVQRSQPDLFVKIDVIDNSLLVEHKLLNPGDWISFDIVFDGEPETPPALSFRISGIAQPKQHVVSAGEKRPSPLFWALPKSWTVIVLCVGSMLVIAFGGGGGLLLTIALGNVFSGSTGSKNHAKRISAYFNENQILLFVQPKSDVVKKVVTRIDRHVTVGLLDNLTEFRKVVERDVPSEFLEKINTNREDAIKLILGDIKNSIRESLSSKIAEIVSHGSRPQFVVGDLRIFPKNAPVALLFQVARDFAIKHAIVNERDESIDSSAIIPAIVLTALGVCLGLIVAGAWKSLG